jgi:hypothetical protein
MTKFYEEKVHTLYAIASEFVAYYDKRGPHMLGNGQARKSYDKFKKCLEEILADASEK